MKTTRADQPSRLICSSVTTRSTFSVLLLMRVTRASVRLDRQAGDDGVDAALLDDGAALRPLQLGVDIVVDRVIMGPSPALSGEEGFLGVLGRKAQQNSSVNGSPAAAFRCFGGTLIRCSEAGTGSPFNP